MIVDDEPYILKMIAVRLKSNGYEVVTAGDGAQCLSRVEKENPDAVLLDLIMPGLSGFEVCRKLKENEKTRHIPVIMLTALAQKSDIAQGLEAGACFFVTKPYNPEDLLEKIQKAIE